VNFCIGIITAKRKILDDNSLILHFIH